LHTPGYVYAYAFGELLVLALYEEYQHKPEGFADRYLSLLEAGGSEWPHELIARMGLNIQDPQFWQRGLASFERMILRAEELYAQVQNQ
jgi:oligoendopeptidase F